MLSRPEWWGEDVSFFGVDGPADLGAHSRSLGWQIGEPGRDANAWWEPLTFAVPGRGPWRRVVDSSLPPPDDIVDRPGGPIGATYVVGPRTVVILER